MPEASALVFHFDLVQDVAVLGPVMRLSQRFPSAARFALYTEGFRARDANGIWYRELMELCARLGVEPVGYSAPLDVFKVLRGFRGIILAGSESSVDVHRATHDLYRSNVPNFLKVTLQHGFECLGFMHNEKHTSKYGRNVVSSADILASWFPGEHCRDLPASQLDKLLVTGPSIRLDHECSRDASHVQPYSGFVCENMHSVRFDNQEEKSNFFSELAGFGKWTDGLERDLFLRPHPAGQFSKKSGVSVPVGFALSEGPLRAEDLRRFSFCISPASTIALDFAFARVPVAIWSGMDDSIDVSNYCGLPTVRYAEDWWRFVQRANLQRNALLSVQDGFLRRWGIPDNVVARFSALLRIAFR